MTDQELLQAISKMIQESEERSGQRTAQLIQESENKIMKNVAILMDADFGPRFNLLGEQIDLILERLPESEDAEIVDTRISALEATVKKHSREIKELKKAT